MKLVIDMNLSPAWEGIFAAAGIEAVHWSRIGQGNAPDSEIMEWAARCRHIVFTHDLDFGTILRHTAALEPSVIQIRAEDVRPQTMGHLVIAAIHQATTELYRGAILTIDPRKKRIALLPLQPRP